MAITLDIIVVELCSWSHFEVNNIIFVKKKNFDMYILGKKESVHAFKPNFQNENTLFIYLC